MHGTRTLLVLIVALTACGPIGPFPGGALSGEPGAANHGDWAFARETETAQLETRPADPHSVNVWFANVESRVYVPTSMILGKKNPTARSWVNHVTADPRVRIRIEGRVFEREAVRVADEDEFEAARAALEEKYDLDERDPERTIWIYRLDPRSAAG